MEYTQYATVIYINYLLHYVIVMFVIIIKSKSLFCVNKWAIHYEYIIMYIIMFILNILFKEEEKDFIERLMDVGCNRALWINILYYYG